MSKLSNAHYTCVNYKERFNKKDVQEILLNEGELIICNGYVYKIKVKHVGAEIYEISKDLEAYEKDSGKTNTVDKLKSVLCSPDGKVSIRGSDKDKEIIQQSLMELSL